MAATPHPQVLANSVFPQRTLLIGGTLLVIWNICIGIVGCVEQTKAAQNTALAMTCLYMVRRHPLHSRALPTLTDRAHRSRMLALALLSATSRL